MMKYTLLCIAFALIASQSINGNPRGILEDVQAGLTELTKKVQEAIDFAIEKVQQAFNRLLEFAKTVVENTTGQIKAIVQKVLDQIEALKKHANETGANILECTQEPEHTLLELPEITIKKLVGCIDNQIKKGTTIFENGKKEIGDKISVIADLTSEFGKCKTNILCLAGVLAKIGTSTIAIPIQVAKSGLQIVDAIIKVQTELASCGVQTVGELIDITGDILIGVTKCVDEKSHNSMSVSKELNDALIKALNF